MHLSLLYLSYSSWVAGAGAYSRFQEQVLPCRGNILVGWDYSMYENVCQFLLWNLLINLLSRYDDAWNRTKLLYRGRITINTIRVLCLCIPVHPVHPVHHKELWTAALNHHLLSYWLLLLEPDICKLWQELLCRRIQRIRAFFFKKNGTYYERNPVIILHFQLDSGFFIGTRRAT